MKKIYILLLVMLASNTVINNLNAQNNVYWREGFPRAGGSTFATATGNVATTPAAYYRSGSGLGWYTFGGYNATAQVCASNGNTADHIRLLGAAIESGTNDSAYLITPTVNFGIYEFHLLRTRVGRRLTLYKTTDTVASTTNWVKVAFFAGSIDPCADTTIIVNDVTSKRLKIVIQQGQDTDIDSIWMTSVNQILPVAFSGINAAQLNGSVKISWNIASEQNAARYEIERSNDGRIFSVTGQVAATNAGKYNWIDNNISNGDNYYRIRAIDKDGSSLLSSIVRVRAGSKNQELAVLPNPVKNGLLTLQLSNFEKAVFNITLFNGAGQQVFAGKIANETGVSNKTIQLPAGIQPGIYRLQLSGADVKVMKQVVVE